MLLVVRNQTFPPFGVIVRIVSLIDKMVDNIVHDLRQYKIWLFVIIHHKKMSREKYSAAGDPFLFI
jgi:hypothetical protein